MAGGRVGGGRRELGGRTNAPSRTLARPRARASPVGRDADSLAPPGRFPPPQDPGTYLRSANASSSASTSPPAAFFLVTRTFRPKPASIPAVVRPMLPPAGAESSIPESANPTECVGLCLCEGANNASRFRLDRGHARYPLPSAHRASSEDAASGVRCPEFTQSPGARSSPSSPPYAARSPPTTTNLRQHACSCCCSSSS